MYIFMYITIIIQLLKTHRHTYVQIQYRPNNEQNFTDLKLIIKLII